MGGTLIEAGPNHVLAMLNRFCVNTDLLNENVKMFCCDEKAQLEMQFAHAHSNIIVFSVTLAHQARQTPEMMRWSVIL
eukprot:9943524-Karenia_brevis.AAC.1